METNEQSSEVKEEQDLTQEALDAANTEEKETPAEVEPETFGPKAIAEISRQRTAKQDALVANARLEGKLEALETQNIKAATVSPLDAEIAKQKADGIEEEDMQISPTVIKADKLYEQTKATQAAEARVSQELVTLQGSSVKTARGVHDDWDEVINAGQSLLSDGEHLDVSRSGDKYGEIAYTKCKAAIERNKPVEKTEAAPEKELSKSEAEAKVAAEAKAKADALPSQEVLLKERKSENPAIDAKMRL